MSNAAQKIATAQDINTTFYPDAIAYDGTGTMTGKFTTYKCPTKSQISSIPLSISNDNVYTTTEYYDGFNTSRDTTPYNSSYSYYTGWYSSTALASALGEIQNYKANSYTEYSGVNYSRYPDHLIRLKKNGAIAVSEELTAIESNDYNVYNIVSGVIAGYSSFDDETLNEFLDYSCLVSEPLQLKAGQVSLSWRIYANAFISTDVSTYYTMIPTCYNPNGDTRGYMAITIIDMNTRNILFTDEWCGEWYQPVADGSLSSGQPAEMYTIDSISFISPTECDNAVICVNFPDLKYYVDAYSHIPSSGVRDLYGQLGPLFTVEQFEVKSGKTYESTQCVMLNDIKAPSKTINIPVTITESVPGNTLLDNVRIYATNINTSTSTTIGSWACGSINGSSTKTISCTLPSDIATTPYKLQVYCGKTGANRTFKFTGTFNTFSITKTYSSYKEPTWSGAGTSNTLLPINCCSTVTSGLSKPASVMGGYGMEKLKSITIAIS